MAPEDLAPGLQDMSDLHLSPQKEEDGQLADRPVAVRCAFTREGVQGKADKCVLRENRPKFDDIPNVFECAKRLTQGKGVAQKDPLQSN